MTEEHYNWAYIQTYYDYAYSQVKFTVPVMYKGLICKMGIVFLNSYPIPNTEK